MKENDLAAVLEIESAAQFHPWTRQNFVECLNPGFISLVASEIIDRADKNGTDKNSSGERIIGFALLSIQVVEMELLNIAVAPEYRGNGIAQSLLRALREKVNTLGAVNPAPTEKNIFLEVRESNLPAINLYQNFGFIQTGKRKNYYPTVDGREAALLFKLVF
jgi:ribosomal-protein-alanine N-acetyltransferase